MSGIERRAPLSHRGALRAEHKRRSSHSLRRWLRVDRGERTPSTDRLYRGRDTRYNLLELTTTAQNQGRVWRVDEPRPLVVPSANRGNELMVRFTAAEVEITSVDIFELYEVEWSLGP